VCVRVVVGVGVVLVVMEVVAGMCVFGRVFV